MKALIILALVVLISTQQYFPSLSLGDTFQCPDEKIKIGEDVCAITSSEHASKNIPYITYIKKKSCGKNKKCGSGGYNYNKNTDTSKTGGSATDTIYTCRKKLKLLKIKKKCNYNAECYTGFCNGKKCAAYGDSDTCSDNKNCGPDRYCGVKTGSTTKTCIPYLKEGEDCKTATSGCAPGLECYTKDGTSFNCKKYFSLDKGDYGSKLLCKSMYVVGGKCAEITEFGNDCKIKYDDGTNTNVEKQEGYKYDNKNYCYYTSGWNDLVSDIKKRYDKIKLDKVLEKENCDYETYYCDKKYGELIEVYNNYETLLNQQLIKDDGKKNGDKKCEYEYWRSVTVSSSYVSVCLGLAFALLGLLF